MSGRELSGQLSVIWLPTNSHSSWTGDCPERDESETENGWLKRKKKNLVGVYCYSMLTKQKGKERQSSTKRNRLL